MRMVIIGNSAAGVGGIEGIRQVDQASEITVIAAEQYHTYSRPLISYFLCNMVSEDEMRYRPADFYEQNRVKTRFGEEVTRVDVSAKKVLLASSVISYDRLLIATGGQPFLPPLQGLHKKNIYNFSKLDDAKRIKSGLRQESRVVIVGGGLIGLKAAEGLVKLGLKPTVVELADRVLSTILDGTAAPIVQEHLEQRGVRFELNTTVNQVLGNEEVTAVTLQNGKTLECDMLIMAIGVLPNLYAIRNTPVEVNRGILVDERMETNIPGIYAAGDVAEGYDMVNGTPRVLPLLPNAYRQGETAGRNMAGLETAYAGGFAMNSITFLGLPMITAGITLPAESNYEVLEKYLPHKQSYKKIVLKDNVVVGYIALNCIDRAGILTGLIAGRINAESFKGWMLDDGFGIIHFPRELRQKRLGSEGKP